MRRTMLHGAAVMGAALVLASAAGAQTAAQDSVVVTGGPAQANPFFTDIDINAISDPSGENPSGRVTFTVLGGFFVDGPVTCLSVSGNVATLNFQDEGTGFGIVTVQAIDDQADTFNAAPVGRAPTDCSPPTGWVGVPLSAGDIVVRDAPPLPTSKDQCKDGGWKSLGFRNQGDCVSFVASGQSRR